MDKSTHNPRVYVDRMIDDSYYIVKQVYLGLDIIKAVNDSLETINTLADNLEEIHNVQDAADFLNILNINLDKVLDVQNNMDAITTLVPYVADINTVAINIEHVRNAKVNADNAEKFANEAKKYQDNAKDSADLAKAWAVGTGIIEGNLYSSRKYAIDASEANKNSQEILDANKEIGDYLKANESVYYIIKQNADATNVVASNINSVVNVATDLKGESPSDISKDLGMIGDDNPEDTTVITGGNIKKVADDIASVKINADNITVIKNVANAIDSLEETTQTFQDLLNQTKESSQSAEQASQSSKESSDLAKAWAIKTDGTVADDEYSAKYYALKAKTDGTAAVNNINTAKTSALTEISSAKTQSIEAIQSQESSSTTKLSEQETSIANALDTQKTDSIDAVKVQEISTLTKLQTQEAASLTKLQEKETSVITNLDNDVATYRAEFTAQISEAKTQVNLAKAWANKTDGTVDNNEYSAKYYALKAKTDGTSAVNTALTSATNEITTAKTSALDAISSAATQSIEAVQAQETSSLNNLTEEVTIYRNEFDAQVSEATKQANVAKDYADLATSGQLNSDWNETDSTSKSFIKNKPDIYLKTEIDSKLNTKVSTDVYTTDKAALAADMTEKLSQKQNTGDYATKAELSSAVATLATTKALTDGLANKLDATAKAESAKTADSVAWADVTGKEKVRTTDTKLTLKDFNSIDLGMIG